MTKSKDFKKYKLVQDLAKATMDYCCSIIAAGISLTELREWLEKFMLKKADSFWYYGIGAFIFADKNTTISVSGQKYKTADYRLKDDDIITVDLSPQLFGYWGDYARTIIIEGGIVKDDAKAIINAEWKEGILFQKHLHQYLCDIARPDMTFADLFNLVNKKIRVDNFVNLDFKKNLGHSIQKDIGRIYIDENNNAKLSSVPFFTFEPHISRPDGLYGFKQEDIYYFKRGKAVVL